MLFLNRNSGNVENTYQNSLLDNVSLNATFDLDLGSDLDLALDASGDTTLTNSSNSVISNLFRRLTTAVGGYERYFFDENGNYAEYDTGWTDPLLNAVAAPLNSNLADWASQKLAQLTEIDSRITLVNISKQVNGQQIYLKVIYYINGETKEARVNLPL